MTGSMRQRGRDTWEPRVYLRLDPDPRRRRHTTRTVHGTRRAAAAAMSELVEAAARSTSYYQIECYHDLLTT